MYDKKYLFELLGPQRVEGEDAPGPYDVCTLTESVGARKLRLYPSLGLENASGKGDYLMRYVGGFSEESSMVVTYVGLELARSGSTGCGETNGGSPPLILSLFGII